LRDINPADKQHCQSTLDKIIVAKDLNWNHG
jgi:hypothetical protein